MEEGQELQAQGNEQQEEQSQRTGEQEQQSEKQEKQQEEKSQEQDISDEQRKKIIDEAIEKGQVVDYETRFKPIYGALKQTERDLAAIKTGGGSNQGQQGGAQQGEPDQSGFNKPKPKLEDFQSYEEYTEAFTDWKLEKKDFEKQAAAERHDQETKRMERDRTFNEQVDKATAKDPEFLNKGFIPKGMIEKGMLDGTQKLAELAYYFGEQPEEAIRIMNMDPISAARHIGMIEAKLNGPEQRTRTNAPNPTTQSGGSSTVRKSLADLASDDSYDEYKALRKAGQI